MIRSLPRRRFRSGSRSGSRDGVALIIVLAGIVLLAILIVSYVGFTGLNRASTASYSKTIQAQEVAMGGLQDILADLHSEISAGSTGGGLTNAGVVAYVPSSAATAQPARLGYTAASWTNDYNPAYLAPTLVRVSRASQDATPTDVYPLPSTSTYTGAAFPINRASAVSTTKTYGDGTYISPARWNKTYLLATNAASVPTPFTTTPPDWVYVTRTGSRVCQNTELATLKPSANLSQNYGTVTPGSNPPASPIVGRYAFIIYDEGALLDANAAGYTHLATNTLTTPTVNNPGGVPQAVYDKSYLAYADLTQLPGLSGNQSIIDNLVNWRNASAGTTGTVTGPNYLQAVFTNAQNGFLSFQSSATGTDSPLLGRQDLINYFTSIDPNINTGSATYSKALPYLGTFSRTLNAPSWYPPLNSSSISGYTGTFNGTATSIVSYNSNMESSGVANRDLANVRWPSTIAAGTSIPHYNDSGTLTPYTVGPGYPMLQRRFSLAKLAWLTHTGPATGISATAIQSCFGLAWNSTYLRWDYYGTPTNTSATGTIETLDQIAAETTPREPNFFELLKAGILSGSLGKNPGVVTKGTFLGEPQGTALDTQGPMGSGFDQTSGNADFQIIQIGVNIIDQSRADNYPSAVYFNFNPAIGVYSPTETALYQTAFGKKNLPYFQGMCVITAVTANISPTQEMFSSWLQPELWNPHQNSYSSYPGTVAPTQLRMVTLGQSQAMSVATTDPIYPASTTNPGPIIDFGEDLSNPTSNGLIYFANSANFFNFPVPLTDAYAGSTPTPSQNSWPTSVPNAGPIFAGVNQFYGVFTGTVTRNVTSHTAPGQNNIRINPQAPLYPLTFVLEYFDGTNWMPYSTIARINYIGPQQFSSSNGWGNPRCKIFFGSPEPRTDRFSAGQAQAQGNTYDWVGSSTIQSNSSATGVNIILCGYPRVASGFNYTPAVIPTQALNDIVVNLWAQNQVSPTNPDTTQYPGYNAYYPDPDGVVRPADSYRGNLTSGYGMMTYHVGSGTATEATSAAGRRSVILNRPFLSVGELGYVFRDLPFKSLDFWSNSSADAALLDLFSVTDEPQVVGGQVNPDNAPLPVLQAVIAGTMQNLVLSPNVTLAGGASSEAAALATQLSTQINTSPLRNRADLVTAVSNVITAQLSNYPNLGNKAYAEAPVRALADVTNTRTWNLFIDVIAQAGQLSPNASSIGDFLVQGERRYWLHIAIDRYTGKIIDQQLEQVYE